MAGFLLLMAIGLALYAAFLIASTLVTLQFPPRRTYAWAVSRRVPGDPGELSPALAFRRFEFSSRGRTLVAWDIEGRMAGGPLLVLTHGWSDSKVGSLSRVHALAPLFSRVISWDLPGHGESGGPCELGMRESEDLSCLLGSIGPHGGVPLVLMGWSLGAGVSLVTAANAEIAGVIAEAPYRLAATPARNVMRARGSPWRMNLPAALWLIRRLVGIRASEWRGFDRAEQARSIRCPLLVLHGSDDAVCPGADARAIASAAPESTRVEIPGARHNDMWTKEGPRDQATRAVATFLLGLDHSAGVGRSS